MTAIRSLVSVGLLVLILVGACKDSSPEPTVVDAPKVDARIADAAPDATASCFSDAGCFVCQPEQLDDFLNACTDGQCFGFDNVARLPRYNNGNLPPLP